MNNLNNPKLQKYYLDLIHAVASLSNLFSNSNTPYINYRVVENVFCKAFNAENLSRSDTAFDAKVNNIGIGIKTFINHGIFKAEKIAEFNSLSYELRKLKSEELALKLSILRNERIDFAKRTYAITKSIYHCLSRTQNKVLIYETNYEYININKIKVTSESKSSLHFKDNLNEYSFNFSKSTLFKKFYTPDETIRLHVNIIDDPFDVLLNLLKIKGLNFNKNIGIPGKDYVILPLYSLSRTKGDEKIVAEKSGLNQWNAGGRERDFGEVYIPVPTKIHKNFPDFFPARHHEFVLKTPSGEELKASICQDNSKALMTNPNNALSDWMLRNVLNLEEGELLTYNKLKEVGVDSVIVNKLNKNNYIIDFSPLDSYDEFKTYMRL